MHLALLLGQVQHPAGYRDWRSAASLALDAVSSAHSKRVYEKQQRDGRWVLVFVDLVGQTKENPDGPIPPFDERCLFSFSPASVRSAE